MAVRVSTKTEFRVAQSIGGGSGFAQRVKAAAGKKMEPMIQRVADDAVARIDRYTNTNYQRRTDDRRRRYPGTPNLHGSFTAKVDGAGKTAAGHPTFPFTITVTSAAPLVVVRSLNDGAKAHPIPASDGKFLYFPRTGLGLSAPSRRVSRSRRPSLQYVQGTRQGDERVGRRLRHSKSRGSAAQASGKRPLVKALSVNHPGVAPSYFMELALEAAVRNAMRRNVRLPRH